MTVAVSTGLYYTIDYREILDILAEAGAENLEILLNTAFIDIPVEELKEEIDRRAFKVSSIHLPFAGMAYEKGQNEDFWIKEGIRYLSVLGGDTLVSHFYYQDHPQRLSNDEKHFPLIEKHTKQNPELFITTENMPLAPVKTLHQDREGLQRFLEDRECYLTFDTTHAATHGQDILEDLDLYFNHIRNIHLSDFADGQEHKILGKGRQPMNHFIRRLSEKGYRYPLTLEYDFENKRRNDIRSNKEAVGYLRESIEFIKEIISES